MTSIFFVIERIGRNQFKCNYLKKLKTYSEVFTQFLKSASNVKHFEKKDNPHSLCIFEIPVCERLR